MRNARSARLQAEAEEAFHRRREALGGIAFEVDRAYAEMIEAQKRLEVMQRGEKTGKRWILVSSSIVSRQPALKVWIDRAMEFVGSLPPK